MKEVEAIKKNLPEANFDTENGKITAWRSKDIPQPSKETIQGWVDAAQAEKVEALEQQIAAERDKVNLIDSVRTKLNKLGFTDDEINLFGV